ncbi:G-protein coupled receptor GRL101-like [Biomphalaria glabrata]|uniref:G-protein coupled receptor GRL101-like n=1 Tax=Biomphalaria glabrata TaxID=6526 RepID=A0A9W2YF08_BIOGL|nr:G-protein coupled receptor GRL101-like [Biomphalaria glabrata]
MLDNAYTALTSVPTSSNLSLAMPNNSQRNIDASIIPLLNCQNQGNILYNLMCGSHFRWFRCDEMRLCQLGCDVDEFRCKSGKCIGKEHKCDLYKDCEDGDDEQDCFKCQHALCSDGRCLPKHWLGDGEVDCDTCTDDDIELEMKASGDEDITKCVFLCNKTKCVYEAMLHDGVLDCRGPEGPLDETLGALASTVCYQKEYPSLNYSNWAPKCVYIKDDFEELIGCRNMKHLEDCQNFECPEGYVKCPEAYCIPLHYVNNNKYDCPNGEDESTSIALECPGYFMCDNNQRQKMCLHPDFVCDGKEHCPEGEDEINCNVQCLTGLLCVSGAVVVIDPSAEVDLNLIDVRTRYIDISGTNAPNVFSVQPAHSFNNLIEARFARCNIVSLNFSSLFSVLYKLDLSGNYIESIENQSVLTHMPVLRYLNLSRNTLLSVIQANAFNNNKIEELDLSYTNIRDVTFTRPLCELKKFFLVNTPIALRSLTSSLYEKSLHELDLRGVKDDNVWPDMFKHIKICYSLRVDNFKFCCRQLHNVDTSLKACTATPDPFSSCSDLMDSTILRIFLWTTGMFSILGNAVVIFYRFVYDRKAFGMGYGHFVLNLGLSDFLMGVYLIIVASADMHYRGSYLWGEQGWRSSVTCKASGFLSTLSNETSIFFIFLITLDRFLVIRFPFGQVKIRSRVAIAICVVTWSVGIALALIPGLHYFGHWSVYTTTGVCVGLPLNPLADTAWLYSQSIFIYVNFLLFLLITAGQVVIYKTMSKMRVEKECLTNVGKRRLQDITVAKNLLLVVVTNFLCWFPIGLLGVMTLCGYQMDKDVYAWTAVLVLPINSAINPILYTVPSIVQNYQKSNEQTTRPSSQTTSV